MDDRVARTQVLQPPSREMGERVLESCRRTYQRTLACWAGDVLELRRTGVLRHQWLSDGSRRAA